MSTVRFLSVCSGIEAASVAWGPLGWTAAGFSEIERFPSEVLAHHYGANMPGEPLATNGVPNFGDFTTILIGPTSPLGHVDGLVGGTPCQAFSVAGKRLSLADARGNLSLAFAVLAHDLADNHGTVFALWENVPGVLSTDDNAFGCFLGALVGSDDALLPCPQPRSGKSNAFWTWFKAGKRPVLDDDGNATGEFEEKPAGHRVKWPSAGMAAGPRARLAWRVLDAQYFGLAQRRRRVFVVVDLGAGAVDPAAVLFEPAGLSRNPPSRGEAGQGIAGTLSARTHGGGGLGTDTELDGGLVPCIGGAGEIAGTVRAKWAKGTGGPAGDELYNLVAHALRAEGFDASEDGTGRGTPIVPVCFEPTAGRDMRAYQDGTAPGLKVGTGFDMGLAPAVAFDLRGRDGGAMPECPHDTANLCAARGWSSRSYVAFSAKDYGADASVDLAPTLRAGGFAESHANGGVMPAVATPWAVRRLTPQECERLQGFPDGYTAIPRGDKPASECPDGPRYKALGNSWAVPVVRWIGERIDAQLRGEGRGQ